MEGQLTKGKGGVLLSKKKTESVQGQKIDVSSGMTQENPRVERKNLKSGERHVPLKPILCGNVIESWGQKR